MRQRENKCVFHVFFIPRGEKNNILQIEIKIATFLLYLWKLNWCKMNGSEKKVEIFKK